MEFALNALYRRPVRESLQDRDLEVTADVCVQDRREIPGQIFAGKAAEHGRFPLGGKEIGIVTVKIEKDRFSSRGVESGGVAIGQHGGGIAIDETQCAMRVSLPVKMGREPGI